MAKNNTKSTNLKITVLTFMSDILFKYILTQIKTRDSKRILNFITQNVLNFVDNDLVVQNPNINPSHYKQKNITVDTLFKSPKRMVIIEMQATKMCQKLWNRFILYLSLVSSSLIHRGQNYSQVVPTYMILFAREYDKKHPSLIVKKSWMDKKYRTLVNQNCQAIYLVQVPYIKEIVKKRKKLTDFEAFVYYLYYNHLDNIEFDDKDGILELMQKEKEIFTREEKDMYDDALERFNLTIDYDELLEENIAEAKAMAEEKAKRQVARATRQARRQARKQAERQAKKQANKEIQKAKEIADKATERADIAIEEKRQEKERADKAIEEKRQEKERADKATERADKATEETRQEKEKTDKATNDAKNITLNLFKQNYPKENTSFLNHLSITQYHQIINLLINKASLNKIKALVL